MRGADFGMGALVNLVFALLIVSAGLLLLAIAALVFWATGIEPRWWMAAAVGGFALGFWFGGAVVYSVMAQE